MDRSLYLTECPGNCVFPCDFDQYDSCVRWTQRQKIDCYGIDSYDDNARQNLSDVVYKIGAGSCAFIKANFNDVSCLPGIIAPVALPTYEAVNALRDWACNLNTSQIASSAPLYCLGNNLSPSGYVLQSRGMNWGLQTTGDTASFYYNLDEIIRDLPGDIQFMGADVKLIGRSSGSVTTMHQQANSLSGAFQVDLGMVPGHVEFKLNFSSPTGQIILENTVAIGGLSNAGPFNSTMYVRDYGSYQNQGTMTLNQREELMALKLCGLDSYVQNLRYINLTPCEGITYPDTNIVTVIGVQHGWMCSHERRLNNIGAEKIQGLFCDITCDKEFYETTLQEWANTQDKRDCTQDQEIADLKQQVAEQKAQIEQILKKLG